MGKVGSNTGRVDDIIKSKLINMGRLLQEKGERLSNATSGSENNYRRIGQLVSLHHSKLRALRSITGYLPALTIVNEI